MRLKHYNITESKGRGQIEAASPINPAMKERFRKCALIGQYLNEDVYLYFIMLYCEKFMIPHSCVQMGGQC